MKSNKWIYVFTISFMMSLWCIDVSITSLNLGILTNGIWSLNPTQSYHLGLYGAILSFVMILFILDYRGLK